MFRESSIDGFVSEPSLFRVDDYEDISLFDYQEESLALLRKNFEDIEVWAQILSLFTGAGKTVCASYLLRECWRKGRHGIFVVDRLSLLGQTSRMLDKYGVPHGVVQASHPRYQPGELIQVASIQTLARRGWPKADLIVADEQHVLYRTMTAKIARRDARIVGLTATPFTRGLGRHYQKIVNPITANELIKKGVIVPFETWASKEPDMTGAKVTAGEWTDEEAEKRSMPIVGDVVKEYRSHGRGLKFVCFGVNIAHCEEIQRQFLMAGISVALYTNQTEEEEREMLIGKNGEFRKPDSSIRGLISVAALSRGFDVPDIGVVIMCRPLKNSFMEFVQALMRGGRSHPGKDKFIVLDLSGNMMRHWAALVEFMEDGVNHLDDGKPKPPKPSIKEEKKPRKCPACKFVFGAGACCPSCGFVFAKTNTVKHGDGELGAFDGKAAIKYDRAAKIQLHGELTHIAGERRYKSGWISHKYRAITGVWPQGMPGIPLPPSATTLAIVARMARQMPKRPATVKCAPARAYSEVDLFS